MVVDLKPRRQQPLMIFVVDADPVGVKVGQIHHNGRIRDTPVKGEAHGALVRVLLAANAAVAVVATMVVRVKVVVCPVIAASDVDCEPDL